VTDVAKSALRAAIYFFIAAGFVYWWNHRMDCDEGFLCYQSGEPMRVAVRGFDISINGLSRLDSARAELIIDGTGERIPLRTFESFRTSWDDEIASLRPAIKGVPLTSIQEPMTVYVGVEAAGSERLVGRTGTVRYRLNVTYPQLDEPEDRVADGVANNIPVVGSHMSNKTFFNRHESFDHEERVRVVAAPAFAFRFWPIVFWVLVVLGCFCALAALPQKGDSTSAT
jgi:hypothetical protein